MKTILVVDVQNGFLKPQVKGLPARIAAHIKKGKYDHVLFSAFVNKEDSNFVRLLDWKKVFKAPDTDLAPELAPFARADAVFTKTAYSSFKSAKLRSYLKKHNIKKIEVCGLEADGCVLATAYEGFDLGYEMVVLNSLMQSTSTLNRATANIVKRNIDRKVKKR